MELHGSDPGQPMRAPLAAGCGHPGVPGPPKPSLPASALDFIYSLEKTVCGEGLLFVTVSLSPPS